MPTTCFVSRCAQQPGSHAARRTLAVVGLLLCTPGAAAAQQLLFTAADSCIACHNGLTSPSGEDLSIGTAWRPSMMANAARDPYWQAAVRREVLDHPKASAAIQHECAACHMPMTRYQDKLAGRKAQVLGNLPQAGQTTPLAQLAADGVSCSLCHQITPARLGQAASYTAGFVVDASRPMGQRRAYGPYRVTGGLKRVMRSASDLEPVEAQHLKRSEMCATCHTLFTHTLGPDGRVVGTLPEQVPYLEWKHSAYRRTQSCQDCHMPPVEQRVAVTNVLGTPRERMSRHAFRGGNFFMPRLFSQHRAELGVVALPQELDAAAKRAEEHLSTRSARLTVERVARHDDALLATIKVQNLAGHKLPTAYPSRRAWLHVTIRDAGGRVLLESGALDSGGKIKGNDNDEDGRRFEPHHDLVDRSEQVQIYEVVMVDPAGTVTTGLLSGVRYVKDNRLLPAGFSKRTAPADVAVHGAAARDPSFEASTDRVTFRVPTAGASGPFSIEAELVYQPIGYRWAQNLRRYKNAPEPARFVRFFDGLGQASAVVLARAEARFSPPAPQTQPAPAPPATE